MLVLMPVLPGSQLVSSSSSRPLSASSVSSSLPLASSVFIFTMVSSFLPSRPPSTSVLWTSCHFSPLPPVPLTTTWRRDAETYFYNIQTQWKHRKDSKKILWFFPSVEFFFPIFTVGNICSVMDYKNDWLYENMCLLISTKHPHSKLLTCFCTCADRCGRFLSNYKVLVIKHQIQFQLFPKVER